MKKSIPKSKLRKPRKPKNGGWVKWHAPLHNVLPPVPRGTLVQVKMNCLQDLFSSPRDAWHLSWHYGSSPCIIAYKIIKKSPAVPRQPVAATGGSLHVEGSSQPTKYFADEATPRAGDTNIMQSGSARPLGAKGDFLNVQNSEETPVQTVPDDGLMALPEHRRFYMIGPENVSLETWKSYHDLKVRVAKLGSQQVDFFLYGIGATIISAALGWVLWGPAVEWLRRLN